MKTTLGFCLSLIVLVCVSVLSLADERGKDPVMGLKRPGKAPEVFMPDRIPGPGGRLHGGVVFNSGGDRIMWSVIVRSGNRPRGVIRKLTWDGSRWTGPVDVPFSGVLLPQAPVFGPSGDLYFQARHPDGPGGVDICRVEPSSPEGDSRALPEPLNSAAFEGQPSFTEKGDMYLAVSMPGSGWNRGIARSRKEKDGWSRPVLLPPPVNSPAIDAYPFVSPRGDFLLFCSSRNGGGEKDLRLLVTFREANDSWSAPLDIGAALEIAPPIRFPSLSPDGEVLFFQKGNTVCWVDAGIIASLRNNLPPG